MAVAELIAQGKIITLAEEKRMSDQEILREWGLNIFRREVKENPEQWEDQGDDIFACDNRVFIVKNHKVAVYIDTENEIGFEDLTFSEVIDGYYRDSLL